METKAGRTDKIDIDRLKGGKGEVERHTIS